MLRSWVEIALIMQILPLFCAVLHDHEQLEHIYRLDCEKQMPKNSIGSLQID